MENSRPANKLIVQFTVALSILIVGGCSKGPEPVEEFFLPAGDVERGKQVFASTGCLGCHTVTGEKFPEIAESPVLQIELGGQVHKVKTYGELLTSIVSPDHTVSVKYRMTLEGAERKEAKSPMPGFNEALNVAQLIDLTEFLHSRYKKLLPQYRGYVVAY